MISNEKWTRYLYQKQTCSRRKTTIKYIHRWLPSGSKFFGQNLGCYYCEKDGSKHDHDYFITCKFASARKESHIKEIIEKLNVFLTPTEIRDGICRGINNYYHITTRTEKLQHNTTPIDAQNNNGQQHFCQRRVSNEFTTAIKQDYSNYPDNSNSTGRGWIKQIIALVLTLHVGE